MSADKRPPPQQAGNKTSAKAILLFAGAE